MYELERAYNETLEVAFDAWFRGKNVEVIESSGRPAAKTRSHYTVTINPGTLRAYNTCRRLTVTDGVLTMMMEDGLISFNSLSEARLDLLGIEMRVW